MKQSFAALIVLLAVLTFEIAAPTKSYAGNKMQEQSNDQLILQLLYQLRDVNLQQNHPEKVCEAIYRIRELKSPLAIDDLVSLIAFKNPHETERLTTVFHQYPATAALAAIGQPALPALVRVIEDKDVNSVESFNALQTLMKIFNYKAAAIDYLEKAKQKSLSAKGVEHLEQAIRKTTHDLQQYKEAGINVD